MIQQKEIEKRFKLLLDKFQNDTCSLNELYELEVFFKNENKEAAIKAGMLSELENRNFKRNQAYQSNYHFEKIKEEINQKQQVSKLKVVTIPLYLVRVAAAIILAVAIGGLSTYFAFWSGIEKKSVVTYCEVVSPLGAKSQVILPDSSIVWLNAGSRIKYPTNYNISNREIDLVGEGYFQVAKNKELPFIVNAFGFLVEAVGTEFNVKAYDEEKTIETILIEGKVRLDHKTDVIAENVFLNPRYKAIFYKDANEAKKNNNHPRLVISPNVDPWPFISWKDDRFIFVSESLKNLAIMLERQYDCSFKFESKDIENFRFSGTLEDETLDQVMDAISRTSPIQYKIKGKLVIINKDKNRTKIFTKH